MKTLTSADSPLNLATIVDKGYTTNGWVALTIAPGKKTVGTQNRWDRQLDVDLARLKELGASSLVCLLTRHELEAFAMAEYRERAAAIGFNVVYFPIPDGGVPEHMHSFAWLVDEIACQYEWGARVVVHCNGGLGRAGTVGACLRLRMGLDATPAEAIATIRQRRSRRAIETRGQEAFVADFLTYHNRRMAPTFEDRVRGAMLGFAVGDALGAPVEFMSPEQVDAFFPDGIVMKAGGRWFKGETTDDTALMLATAQAYQLDSDEIVGPSAADAMLQWYEGGPKDIGNLTRCALEHYRRERYEYVFDMGRAALADHPDSAGNGSLMRTLPVGLVRHIGDVVIRVDSMTPELLTQVPNEMIQETPSSSPPMLAAPRKKAESARVAARCVSKILTHRHPSKARQIRWLALVGQEFWTLSEATHSDERCQWACCAYSGAISTLCRFGADGPHAMRGARRWTADLCPLITDVINRVECNNESLYGNEDGIGYVLLALQRALTAVRDDESFADGVEYAIRLGGDTDTNAALVGGALGAKFGVQGIPSEWIGELLPAHRRKVEQTTEHLLAYAAKYPTFKLDAKYR